jgi:anthranilate phosphoribosyltransferase
MTALLTGRGNEAEVDAVAFNTGALLMTAGLAADLKEGTARAKDALASGEPHRILQRLAEVTHG